MYFTEDIPWPCLFVHLYTMVEVLSEIQQQLNTISPAINSKTPKHCSWKTIRPLLNTLGKDIDLVELRFGVGEFGFVSVRETALVVIKAELEPTSVHFCLRLSFSLLLFWYSGNDFCRPACSQQLRTARLRNIIVCSFKRLKRKYSK